MRAKLLNENGERVFAGYLDWDKKDYERIPVLGRRDGSACGGHLLEALRREHDPATGLALISLGR